METEEVIRSMSMRARAEALKLGRMSTAEKNAALMAMADALEQHRAAIFSANAQDVAAAKIAGLAPALLDRLTLTEERFASMVAGVRKVVSLADPVWEEIERRDRPSGIVIRKMRVPFGVIAVIFESRPNVFIDTAALCLKTGNAAILRGGKEALETNKALVRCVPAGIQLVETTDHAAVRALVRSVGLVDVAIPRGGERLIRAVCEAALIPVLKHYKGVCHLYVDASADLGMALRILDNAKTQRPGVCNAIECLLIDKVLYDRFYPLVEAWAHEKNVTLHTGEAGREYLSLDLNVATVDGVDAAIAFINEHSSHHSDGIVTETLTHAQSFQRDVDSACVYHNASTRFTDGAEFGMGAEIGISTDKLHARGPMGLTELTTYKYVITGQGAVRA